MESVKVEHRNMVYTTTIEHVGRNVYAMLEGERKKVYPTGNALEPWTTNISKSRVPKN